MKKIGFVLAMAVVAVALWSSWGTAYADPPDDKGKPPPGSRGRGAGQEQDGPAAAGQGGPGISSHGGPHATAKGWVSGETLGGSPVTGSFTITPTTGGITTTVNVNVTADTLCKAPGKDNGGKPSNAQCAKILNDYYVTVKGTTGSSIDATRIQLVPGRTFHCVGEVVGDPSGGPSGSLTVACRSNGTTYNRTFAVNGETIFRNVANFAALDDDDVVTVVGTRVLGEPLKARAVVKHGS